MVTEPDVNAIKERIKLILESNTSISSSPDKNKVGFVTIEVGLPENKRFTGLNYPVLFVSNADDFETDKPFGPVTANSLGSSFHVFQFQIIFFDLREDGQAAEKSLDDFQKIIKETLKGNSNLSKPSDGTDPLATSSFPERTRAFSAEFEGEALNGRIIFFMVRVVSA